MKDALALAQELAFAKSKVVIGDKYVHYKHPEREYQIVNVAFLESSEEVCVVYQALYAPFLVWIRPINNFWEKVKIGGTEISRFEKVVI